MRLAGTAISLFRRTGHRPVRTEHATLTGFRLKCLPASAAYIEKLTGVFWHLFGGLMPTVRASDCGDFDHVSTASDPPCGSCCTNPVDSCSLVLAHVDVSKSRHLQCKRVPAIGPAADYSIT